MSLVYDDPTGSFSQFRPYGRRELDYWVTDALLSTGCVEMEVKSWSNIVEQVGIRHDLGPNPHINIQLRSSCTKFCKRVCMVRGPALFRF